MESNSFESLIYCDYNATTPLADEVVQGIYNSMLNDWGNPSSRHPFGAKAKAAINKAKTQIAQMIKCSPSEVIFTSGGTESNNMVINSAVHYFHDFKRNSSKSMYGEKLHIITSNVEHDSVIEAIKHLEEQSVINYSLVDVNQFGCVNPEDVMAKITDHTCLITIMYANNETGVIMPIPEIGALLSDINKERKKLNLIEILFHSDASQIIGKEVVNFNTSKLNFLTVTGHKFYGPRIGCTISKGPLYPMLFGGGQERGIRPGTENTPLIVGLGIAAELITKNLSIYRSHMLECRIRLENKLLELFGDEVVINCKDSNRLSNTANISFPLVGLEGTLVLSRCTSLIAGIGAACHSVACSKVLINSGISLNLARNSIRLSIGRNTTFNDIDVIVTDLHRAVSKLKVILSDISLESKK